MESKAVFFRGSCVEHVEDFRVFEWKIPPKHKKTCGRNFPPFFPTVFVVSLPSKLLEFKPPATFLSDNSLVRVYSRERFGERCLPPQAFETHLSFPKNPWDWDVMGCQTCFVASKNRGCFHRRGRWILRVSSMVVSGSPKRW